MNILHLVIPNRVKMIKIYQNDICKMKNILHFKRAEDYN